MCLQAFRLKTLVLAGLFVGISQASAQYDLFEQFFVGEAIPNFHEVGNNLFRGGRPTEPDLKSLVRDGVKTIINIENNVDAIKKEQQWAKQLNLKFISEPMDWDSRPEDATINAILEAMRESKFSPSFIHCKHGQDRTGLVVGLYRVIVQKWTPNDAYKEMLQLGFHPEYVELDKYFKDRTSRP